MTDAVSSVVLSDVIPGWPESANASGRLDAELLARAYRFSEKAHEGQFRRNGDPFVTHCIEVAKILADLQLDSVTVACGLIHDVIEDTAVTYADIEREFGKDMATIVEGLTKIGHLPLNSTQERQVENYRKLLLSIAKDARVILIKLADRLHNMRTLDWLPEEKRQRIALETRDLYAPLAHRFGMAKMRWELEDLAFKYLEPDEYRNLAQLVQGKRSEREALIAAMREPLERVLREAGIKEVEVTGRPKHLWSIYRKMQQRERPYEEIYDLLAIRVLVSSVPDCYHALGIIHEGWTPLQERIKDYIAQPKSNAYQSLHTTVFGPGRHAPHGGIRHRGALAVQGVQRQVHGAGPRAALVPPGTGAAAGRQLAAGVPRVPQARPVRRRDLRLHADGGRNPAAQGRDADRLCLRGAHGGGDALPGCQGERQDRAAVARAEELGDRRDPHVAEREAQPRLAVARAHGAGAAQDPPVPEARGAADGGQDRTRDAGARGAAPQAHAPGRCGDRSRGDTSLPR
jgi:hypothetical protein